MQQLNCCLTCQHQDCDEFCEDDINPIVLSR